MKLRHEINQSPEVHQNVLAILLSDKSFSKSDKDHMT